MAQHDAVQPGGDAAVLRAREETARATVRFEREDYEAAVAGFLEAYALLEGDPRQAALLNNIAVCYERMFRYDLALKYYERYLREGAADEADRQEVQQVVAGLRGLLGKLRITSNVSAHAWLSEDLQVEVPGEIWVPAGLHELEVRARGYESARREVRVAPRSEQALHVELVPAPRYEGIAPKYFWVGTGLTAAALVVGTGFGIRALREDAQVGTKPASEILPADNARIQRQHRSADIAFGTAALFGVGSLVLFFLTDWGEQETRTDTARDRGRALSWNVVGGPGSAALRLSGRLR